jgi:starvation-inducible DNA-binding protein
MLPVIGNTKGWLKGDDVVDYFVSALAEMVIQMRRRIRDTEQADPVSQDSLIGATADLQ